MTFSIATEKRESGKPEDTRSLGKIPAVVYGPEMESVSICFDYITFEKLYNEAGESSLVDLTVDGGEPTKVLVQDVQYDPVKRNIIHVDFRQIKMGEEMEASIELNFIGEVPAVKALGGTLMKSVGHVNVRCLPKDLVGHIDVDMSVLATFEDSISIKNIVLPTGIIVTDNPESLVAKVAAPLTEDQLNAMEETAETSVEDVEVEGAKEGEEGAKEGDSEEKKDKSEEKKK